MNPTKNNPVSPTADRELVFTRTFNAPRELVWKAWTDPKLVAQWWGPKGFTNTIHEMDVRPGGVWRLTMHGPDGVNYPNRIEFLEVVKPERLVYHHGDDNNPHMFHVTTNFIAEGDRTTIHSLMLFKTAAECAETKKHAVDGHKTSMDRLEEQLAKMEETMTEKNIVTNEDTTDREILISRVFDAPRELVWQAITDPKHVVNWWGPRGFSTTIEMMDVKPGGHWKHVMRGPDGVNYPNHSVFKEVVKPERIVYTHGGHREGGPGVSFVATWSFDAVEAAKTKLTLRMVFPSAKDRDFVVKEFGAIEGGKQTLQRLSEYLPSMTGSPADFVISREFNAPRDLVWKAWTERERLMQWFGPKGFTMPVATLDFRPGGTFLYGLRSPDGKEIWGKFVYREIVKPERIVLVNSFSDANGGTTRHPFSATWPLEMLSTTTFAEHEGKTTVTIRWAPLNATDTERETFASSTAGMQQGWGGTFEQLAAYLANAKA